MRGFSARVKSSESTFTTEPITPNPVQEKAEAIVCGRREKTKGDMRCAVNFKQGVVRMSRRGKRNTKCVGAPEKRANRKKLHLLRQPKGPGHSVNPAKSDS